MQSLNNQLNFLKSNQRLIQTGKLTPFSPQKNTNLLGPPPNVNPIGRRQSYSGSETDVSTSTENLTAEEKHVLYSGIRQEPQGEETSLGDEIMGDPSLSNTLIIHHNTPSDPYSSHFYSKKANQLPASLYCVKDFNSLGPLTPPLTPSLNPVLNVRRRSSGSSPRSSTGTSSIPPSPKGSPRARMQRYEISQNDYAYGQQDHHSVQEITEIPKHYLDQSEVLKHLAKEVHHKSGGSSRQSSPCKSTYPPPPEYPKWFTTQQDEKRRSDNSSGSSNYSIKKGHLRGSSNVGMNKRISVSRSHPDLTRTGITSEDPRQQKPKSRGRSIEVDAETPSSQMLQMIEILSSDNALLKGELDQFHQKVSKLQSFEMEIQKVHQSHEELIRSSEKRERLEKAIRARLEGEIRRLVENNRQLREKLEMMSKYSGHDSSSDDHELRRELSKRDVMIAQLLTQNKELLGEKDRHEIELQAQRATLQEQRNHIDILDNALTNAQTNVVRLEEENRKKQIYVDRVGTLQRALANLQLASDRRLTMEKKMRSQLEKEIETLKGQGEEEGMDGQGRPGQVAKYESSTQEDLKRLLRQYEEKIIGLEAEVTKWEQRYLEESTMRQIAVDAASVPKDVKIAALERTSQESEKLIAQARSERLKHMDELYAAHRKSTELEGRIKDFESKLAERDAMIKVLQQHSQEKDAVLQNAVRGRPPRHSRAVSSMGISNNPNNGQSHSGSASMGGNNPSGVGGGSASLSSTSSNSTLHHRTGSKDEIGISSNLSATKTLTESLCESKKSLDEQLKELDSRLSSKDSIISALRAEKERNPNHFWRV